MDQRELLLSVIAILKCRKQNALGILSQRFQIYQTLMKVKAKNVDKTILTMFFTLTSTKKRKGLFLPCWKEREVFLKNRHSTRHSAIKLMFSFEDV
jgi:hypothetical protein